MQKLEINVFYVYKGKKSGFILFLQKKKKCKLKERKYN